MSALTTEERVALDEIFLSMAVNPSPFRNVKTMMGNVSRTFSKRPNFTYIYLHPMRKTFRYTRLWVRSGCLNCAKRLHFKR